MDGVHNVVGTLLVVAFLALTVVNVLQATGRRIGWARQLSFGAAGLLLLQYVIGFGLLGGDADITPWHYVVALAALIPVGVEHGLANSKEEVTTRGRIGAAAAAATTLLVIVAYSIGTSQG